VVPFTIAAPVFIMAAQYYVDLLEFWHILVLEMLFSVTRTLNPSASQSLLHDLVPEDELLNAVALFPMVSTSRGSRAPPSAGS
jgi:hypothetical protein